MTGFVLSRGSKFGLYRRIIRDSKLSVYTWGVSLFTLRVDYVKIRFDRRGIEEGVHKLCRMWAEESKTASLGGASSKLADDIIRLVYETRIK